MTATYSHSSIESAAAEARKRLERLVRVSREREQVQAEVKPQPDKPTSNKKSA